MLLNKISFFIVLGLLMVLAPLNKSYAQVKTNKPLKSDFEHFYENVTMDKLSKLYWKLGKLDLHEDGHVDNFLFINECDIYKDYFFNEFEWATVRRKAKVFLKENLEEFPVRFKYVQPLRLTEYDQTTQEFTVHPDFQIKGYRKFEVLSQDFEKNICKVRPRENITHYPRILMVEFTQPLTLKSIPMTPILAKEYIEDKLDIFEKFARGSKTKENLYKYRDAYIVMKIKMFSFKGVDEIVGGWKRAALYGMLEGYEIYGDKDHTQLLYFENYIRSQDDARPVNVRLQEQYQALRRKRGDVVEKQDEPEAAVEEEEVNPLMDLKQSTQ